MHVFACQRCLARISLHLLQNLITSSCSLGKYLSSPCRASIAFAQACILSDTVL